MSRGSAVPPTMRRSARTPCMDLDNPDVMYPDECHGDTATALAVCRGCPLASKKRCLEYALRTGEEYGVWGGVTARRRRVIRKRHGWP